MRIAQHIAFLLLMVFGLSDVQGQMLVFKSDEGVHLRWPGEHVQDLQGYHVSRIEEGQTDYARLTTSPITMISSPAELKELLGGKVHLYAALFGKENADQSITANDFASIEQDGEALFGAVCLINPTFGEALGEVFVDNTAIAGKRYAYKVEAITSSGSKKVAESGYLSPYELTAIPAVEDAQASGRAQSVAISWQQMPIAMTQGKVVSFNVYRSEQMEGPWFQANNFQTLSAEISTGGAKQAKTRESFIDPYLTPGKKYYYKIKAMNAFGFEGPASNIVEAIPTETNLLLSPTSLEAKRYGVTTSISWDGTEQEDYYEVFTSSSRRNFAKKSSMPARSGNPQTWISKEFAAGKEYYVYVQAVDDYGQRSQPSDTLRLFFTDTQKPDAPLNVRATAERGKITLNWSPNTESDLLGYQVERSSDGGYKDLFLLTDAVISERSFEDVLPPSSETTYGYMVYAVDESYNRSEPSEMVFARMPDETPPQPPIVTGFSRVNDSLQFTWNACLSTDLDFYEIEMADQSEGPYEVIVRSEQLQDQIKPEQDGVYYFRVVAVDESGNRGASNPLKKTYEARKQPDAPAELLIKKEERNLLISWAEVTDQDVKGYLLTRKDITTGKTIDIAELGSNYLEWLDKYVDFSHEYEYTIRAFDSKWRMSSPTRANFTPDAGE
jgi:fibronectin type 3 domain-containing protein